MSPSSEKETKAQGQKPRASRLVIVLLLFGIGVAWILLIWRLQPGPRYRNGRGYESVWCGTTLGGLGKAMYLYAEANDDRYPSVDKWCDLLVQGDHAVDKCFICPALKTKRGQSNYALNKNVVGMKASEIPPDVVLLFESKEGWNQFGGPELLAPENHGGEGCNILFNDGHVAFVYTEGFGKLKWK